MPEPITIGVFVVGVLVKIAEGGVAELAKSTAKQAYAALKGKVAEWAGAKVEVLEAAPDSEKIRREIAEAIDNRDGAEQSLIRSLAQAVIDKESSGSGRAIALDFGDLKNVAVTLKKVSAQGNATGAQFRRVEGGTINVDEASAASSAKK